MERTYSKYAEHHNFVPTPDKTCPNCGKSFNRMRDRSGRLEDRSVYESRTYCSRACGYEARRRRARREREERNREQGVGACEACGAEARLQVNPIDGDPSDGAAQNTQMLCWRCHSFWYATLKRTGRTAAKMPPLF